MTKAPHKTRYVTPRAARNGSSHVAERFRLAMAIVRADYALTPEISAEADAIARKLEQRK